MPTIEAVVWEDQGIVYGVGITRKGRLMLKSGAKVKIESLDNLVETLVKGSVLGMITPQSVSLINGPQELH